MKKLSLVAAAIWAAVLSGCAVVPYEPAVVVAPRHHHHGHAHHGHAHHGHHPHRYRHYR